MRVFDEIEFMKRALETAAFLGAKVTGTYPEDARIDGHLVRRLDFEFTDGEMRAFHGKERRRTKTPDRAGTFLVRLARERTLARAEEMQVETRQDLAHEINRSVRATYATYSLEEGFTLTVRGLNLEDVGKAARALIEALGQEPDSDESWRKSPLFKVAPAPDICPDSSSGSES